MPDSSFYKKVGCHYCRTVPNVTNRVVANILNRCESQDKSDIAIEVYDRYFSLTNNGQSHDETLKYSLKKSQEIL